ncbi:hypothetical protein H2199_000892 [Coniosporium tulheliwenetii]|uniref:Uncharacterized protein n=1 Tax=Coniosporium tulheliwenetii TaxID=3383036 RepID=A0ACC2ZN26_9PEZI|nr:hypothetical protein H2199_000892 [Cladosporium sp. JES 115]
MASFSASTARKDSVLTRRQIEGLIAEGRSIFIVDGKVFKADAWLDFHPGGPKAIFHMVGRDATDEVKALHSPEALARMSKYQIGRVEGRWTNFLPPIQGGKFRVYLDPETTDALWAGNNLEQDSSSEGTSTEPSPVFEPADGALGLRQRHLDDTTRTRASSTTSISSVELSEIASSTQLSPMDRKTQEEIELDLSKYPSLDAEVQDEIVQKYRQLNERIKAEGLYQCNYSAYAYELCRYTLLFSLFLVFLGMGWYCTSAVFLGMFWHQLVFTAHDAGHMGITHDFTKDTIIGIVVADFIGGLSLGWWKRSHNVHHIVTNSPEHDPDIEQMPFFALSHRFFQSLNSTYYDFNMTYDATARFLVQYQSYLYYPILCLGRFNLYRLSWLYLFGGQAIRKGPAWWTRWFEIAGQLFFWSWFGYGVVYSSIPTLTARVAFVMISHIVTAPLHVQITLSHYAMSTADLGTHESFPQKMLRTTMDVECPQWLDFFHGGLQFQAIHHLYPRIPRHNLRRTQKLVQEFCNEVSIPYALYGFVDGNKEVIGRLGEVTRQAAILAECQRAIVQSGDFGMH